MFSLDNNNIVQGTISQSVIDYWQYTMIFNETETGKEADENAADKSSGTPAAQCPLHPLKRP